MWSFDFAANSISVWAYPAITVPQLCRIWRTRRNIIKAHYPAWVMCPVVTSPGYAYLEHNRNNYYFLYLVHTHIHIYLLIIYKFYGIYPPWISPGYFTGQIYSTTVKGRKQKGENYVLYGSGYSNDRH